MGISADVMAEDVLGIARVQFQGLIAVELASVGYRIVQADDALVSRDPERAPLSLVGVLKDEVCELQAPRQCRVAIQWELQDRRGAAVYRVVTRAVDENASLEKLRRNLVQGTLQSLLRRRRFALQLTDFEQHPKPDTAQEVLGFKACSRADLSLPKSSRSVSAAIVLVESGSELETGSIVSPDGLVLTSARSIDAGAPLRVKLGAGQTLPAEVVALDRASQVALLHVPATFGATCLPVRSEPLATNAAVFGVSSPPSEDRATSLAGSFVARAFQRDARAELGTDPLIARSEGAPLLDEDGRLAGLVSDHAPGSEGSGLEVHAALDALRIKPAAVSDPRLLASHDVTAPLPYVRDRDDPPYVLTRRYTYGSSSTAHTVRKAGIGTTIAGGVGVGLTWALYRGADSESSYNRFVALNDVSWVLFGLGAAAIGASFAIPEGHDVVAVRAQSAAPRRWKIGLGAGGLTLAGSVQ